MAGGSLGLCSAWAASLGPPVPRGDIPWRPPTKGVLSFCPVPSPVGVKPGPPSDFVFPNPGKTSLAHQFVLEKFVQCYEPRVESSKFCSGGWVGITWGPSS